MSNAIIMMLMMHDFEWSLLYSYLLMEIIFEIIFGKFYKYALPIAIPYCFSSNG